MLSTPQFNFSHHFLGKIWRIVALPERNLLFLEVRDDKNFQVKFFALNYRTNEFLWRDLALQESWWIGLKAAKDNTLLFFTYQNKGNPDHQSLIAYNIAEQSFRWQVDGFSFHDWNETVIWGYLQEEDLVSAVIDINSGGSKVMDWSENQSIAKAQVISPVQFLESSVHFDTVKKFLLKSDYSIIKGMDYLEVEAWIIVSIYVNEESSLANYLLVMNTEGEILLKDKLGKKLEGLGTETFFVLSGCLFYIKNMSELVAYKLYD